MPPANVRSQAALPASSARSVYSWPLACSSRSAESGPASLTVPSTGETMALRIRIHRARTRAQCAREEFVEARVGGGLGLHRVGHVGLEAAHEQADQRVLESRRARAGRGEHQAGDAVLRQQVLECDESAPACAGPFVH